MAIYSVVLLVDKATGTISRYPTQSDYPDTEISSPCPILVMQMCRVSVLQVIALNWLGSELATFHTESLRGHHICYTNTYIYIFVIYVPIYIMYIIYK